MENNSDLQANGTDPTLKGPTNYDLQTVQPHELTHVDVLSSLRTYGGDVVADYVEEVCTGYDDETGLEGVDRKKLVSLGLGPYGPMASPVESFLNAASPLMYIKEPKTMEQDQRNRMYYLPNDMEITKNFKMRRLDSRKHNSKKEKWAMILQVTHLIENQRTHMVNFKCTSLKAHAYLIFENIFVKGSANADKKKDEDGKACDMLMKDFTKIIDPRMHPIAQSPQQCRSVKDYGFPGIKRELEGVETCHTFDFRALMYVIGSICAHYMSTNNILIDTSHPASLKINVSCNTRIVDGEIIYTKACGSTDIELNTFCALTGMCKVNTIVLLSDRYSACDKILAGFSLYEYCCRIMKNIMYTANSLSCGTEHLWAFMAGMHNVIKIYAHSDEGGLMRTFITHPTYPTPAGTILEASRDVLYSATELRMYNYFEKRQLLDMLLFFPNALNFSDSGNQSMGFFMPSVFSCPANSKHSPHDYPGLSDSIFTVIENMRALLAKTYSLESAIQDQRNIYYSAFSRLKQDRHLANQIIIPFIWTDAAISNIYNLSTTFHNEDIGYYTDSTIPFFPPGTAVNYHHGTSRIYMHAHEIADITLPSHSMRRYGYAYALNPRYNEMDGLSTMMVVDAGGVQNKDRIMSNYLFSNGDFIIGKNKWTMPHCPINNYYEMFQAVDTSTVRIVAVGDTYLPNPYQMLTDSLSQVHSLSRMVCIDYPPLRTKHGCYVNRVMKRIFDTHLSRTMLQQIGTAGNDSVQNTTCVPHLGGNVIKTDAKTPKQVGDQMSKINNPDASKPTTGPALILNQLAKTSSVKMDDTPPITDAQAVVVDNDLVAGESEDSLAGKVSSGEVLGQTTDVHEIVDKVKTGTEEAIATDIKLTETRSVLHDVDTANLTPAPYEWSNAILAEREVACMARDRLKANMMLNQLRSYSLPPGNKFILDTTALGMKQNLFVRDAKMKLMSNNMVLVPDMMEAGGTGDPNNPNLQYLRAICTLTGQRNGKYTTQLVIGQVTKIGKKMIVKCRHVDSVNTQ